MDIATARVLSLKELRDAFRSYLQNDNIEKNTIQTTCTDSFYLWRNAGSNIFWQVITSENFENEGKCILIKTLEANSKGEPNKLVNGYMSHLRKFRRFLNIPESEILTYSKEIIKDKKYNIDVPTPSTEQVKLYLIRWDELESYHLQEEALDKLFFEFCPMNNNISDILIKVSTLNDFYSTNIFSVYPVAKHIFTMDIDDRLQSGDVMLVNDLMRVTIDGKQKNFYSFATKYCSHHNPLDYPIYDSYVERVLFYFRKRDGFSNFAIPDLKNYARFKEILIEFRAYYELEEYNLKLIDKYIWQLGKEYFPKKYSNKKGENK